jgi:hypothetical protein
MTNMTKKKIDALIAKFSGSVAAQSEAVKNGDARAGNEHAKAYVAAFNELTRTYGDEGREALVVLLKDERLDVRTTAAAFLMRYAEKRARPVLEAAAKGRGLDAFAAGQTLERWKEGALDLDPIDGG